MISIQMIPKQRILIEPKGLDEISTNHLSWFSDRILIINNDSLRNDDISIYEIYWNNEIKKNSNEIRWRLSIET